MDISKQFKGIKGVKNITSADMVISAVLILYIFLNIRPPVELAVLIDESILAQILIYLFGIGVTIYYNPLVGVLTLFASHELIRRSKTSTNGEAVYKYLPSQDKMDKTLTALNQFPITLEEQVVSTMAPLVIDGPSGPPPYVPVLDQSNSSLLSDVDNSNINIF
jgi:hypothetical protein